ncbi:MAG: hypothetical protein AAB778_01730 [Patescibacteria group bacterium]
MDINLSDQAIQSALKCDWKSAIKINKLILADDPNDIEALNRLARAYYESGDRSNAKKVSTKVLSIDKGNNIAKKALQKYKGNKKALAGSLGQHINASDYIEETGTTKQVVLLNRCSEETLSTLDSGDEVILLTHSHRVTVSTLNHKYIGKIPDDLSARLRKLTKSGYKYKVIIKSTNDNCIKVIIKEIERGKGFENVQSFPRELSESLSEFSS